MHKTGQNLTEIRIIKLKKAKNVYKGAKTDQRKPVI